MKMIDVFNRSVSNAVNKDGNFYNVLIGRTSFTPEVTIIDSGDIKCGALCNELEFARVVSDYYVQSLDLALAEEDELEELINAFIELPRRGNSESDSSLRTRFQFITLQNHNACRTTKWAIRDAISYYVDIDNIQIIEPFDSAPCYFQVRIKSVDTTDDIIFMNSLTTGAIDQFFVGGSGIGESVTYIDLLIARIKAAGVDFDVYYIDQSSFTKTCDAKIGSVQIYSFINATIQKAISFTKTCDAKIVAAP
jgi:hypothetical protein